MRPKSLAVLSLLLAMVSFATVAHAAVNELTNEERAAGWRLLFDGKTFAGWRGFLNAPISGWEVKDGTLHAIAKSKGVDLVTEDTFNDFELTWEWKLPWAGNNGVKYFVTEARPKAPGHEYQMLDDENHPDGKIGPRRQTAAFYDVLPPAANKRLNPPGQWNASKIVVRGRHVEHRLNGDRVLAYELGSPEVKAALAQSKFAKEPGFGDKIVGRLMLTYHSDECWFRNLKVRELK
jgi:hypothetical protein